MLQSQFWLVFHGADPISTWISTVFRQEMITINIRNSTKAQNTHWEWCQLKEEGKKER